MHTCTWANRHGNYVHKTGTVEPRLSGPLGSRENQIKSG